MFNNISICAIRNFYEAYYRGKFVRTQVNST